MLKILAICDSFKGTLSSSEVGKIVCEHYNKEGHDAKYIPISVVAEPPIPRTIFFG